MTSRRAFVESSRCRCQLPAGARIAVQLAETGRTFVDGDLVDLDAAAAPGLTWRQALGDHVKAFVPLAADAGASEAEGR